MNTIYHGYQCGLSERIFQEANRLEGDENEIYFYTTPETAKDLVVGMTNVFKSADDLGYERIDVWIGGIETRLSGSLPRSDGDLFFYAVEKEFEDALGKGDYKWGVLVSGEIMT